jgi:hypothetical protein
MAFGVEAEDFIGDSDYEIAKWFKVAIDIYVSINSC